jgi:hypothetical protein
MDKYNVTIKQIFWIDENEAEIIFELKEKVFYAFCHPCDFAISERVEVYFSFIEEEIPENTFWVENRDLKKNILFSENKKKYYCYGQITTLDPVTIDCGDINFSFGSWINDKKIIGSYVYFVISRLDIFRFVYHSGSN